MFRGTNGGPVSRFLLGGAGAVLLVLYPFPALAQESILSMMANLESGDNTGATNANSTATGEYQDTQAALASAGLLQINSQPTASDFGANANWSNVTWLPNQWGITSQQQLLDASPEVQTAIETTYLQNTWQQDENAGLTSFEGQTVNGQELNSSAILGCSELLGTTGCQQYLTTGNAGSAALTANAESVISQYSQADASMITGSATTTVAQSQSGVSSGGENSAGYTQYCNTAASTVINTAAQATYNAAVNIATSPQTGYSLVNGSSILSPVSGGYSEFSCLDNLFDQGLNIVFSPPNLSSILNSLINAACTKSEQAIAQVMEPLNQNFFQATNAGGFSMLGAGLSVGTNNSGSVQTSVDGISTGSLSGTSDSVSANALATQITGQTLGSDFTPLSNQAINFGNAY